VIFPLLGWAALFADGTTATWPATASVSMTFFGCLAALLLEARREHGAVRVALGEAIAA
jgi:hypothetical protein